MTDFYVDFLNEQSIIELDLNKLDKITQNILNFIIEQNDIYSKSVLNGINIKNKNLIFDVLICDDKKIHELNKNYRNKDKPTDVLTFAMFADMPLQRFVLNNNISLGSIIISVETTLKQSKENKKTFEEEFYFLLSHGILHLLGFDHEDETSLNFMLDLQEKMISEGLKNE